MDATEVQRRLHSWWETFRRTIDPNDDPAVEPITIPAFVAFAVATALSTFLFLRWKFQPMQDLGLHASMIAVVADYGRDGSIYPAIYKPFDWLGTNSFLYAVGGLMAKVIPGNWALRICMAAFAAGVPIATLYALRVFGRSAWGAVAAVPLTYTQAFVFGFANFLFAAPFAILVLPLFYRMLVSPTRKRIGVVALVVAILFLTHLHVFLWMGVILATMTVIAMVVSTWRTIIGRGGPTPWDLAAAALASVAPALLLFVRWSYRTSHPAADENTIYRAVPPTWKSYVAALRTPSSYLATIQDFVRLTNTEYDRTLFIAVCVLGAACAAIARLHKWRRPPVLEFACILTFLSYFLMPEHYAGQEVIGSRQIGFALWFAAVWFSPVPGSVSRLGRAFAIIASVWLTTYHLTNWSTLLRKFETDEAAGLDEVLAAAPPRLRMHYVNIAPTSKYFILNTFWHVEKYYMLDKQGQCPENPAIGASQAIRYRRSYDLHRIGHHQHDWPVIQEIWDNFDLILIHRWQPRPQDLALAQARGERLAKHGDWELWRKKVGK